MVLDPPGLAPAGLRPVQVETSRARHAMRSTLAEYGPPVSSMTQLLDNLAAAPPEAITDPCATPVTDWAMISDFPTAAAVTRSRQIVAALALLMLLGAGWAERDPVDDTDPRSARRSPRVRPSGGDRSPSPRRSRGLSRI